MARSKTSFKPGHRGAGGRPKGALNRATIEIRALARGLVEDPAYLAALRRRLAAGKAGSLEPMLFAYAYGRPTERPAGPIESGRPVSTTRGESDTAPGFDLSKEGRERLLGLLQGVGAYLNDVPPMPTASERAP
jgi:hypothetical protein